MEALGIKRQEDAGERLGVSQSKISRALSGGTAGFDDDELLQLSAALHCSVEYLLNEPGVASVAPPVLVDRSVADAPALADDDIPIERAVIDLARDRAYSAADMDIAREAARKAHRWLPPDADIIEIARSYLSAAKALRLEGARVDVASVGVRASIMLSGASVAHVTAASDDANARAKALSDELDAPLKAKPGKKR